MSKVLLRNEIDEKYKWAIDSIYNSIDLWEDDFKKLKEEAPKLENFKGSLKDGSKLLEFLEEYEKVSRSFLKLFLYAHLKSDEDTTVSANQALKNRIDAYDSEFNGIIAFFVPEVLTFDKGHLDSLYEQVPKLKEYKIYLQRVFDQKPYTLNEQEEKILAQVADCLNSPSNCFYMLTNADMEFPEIIDEENKKVQLTESNYSVFIKSKDKSVREQAFKALFNTYIKYKNTLGTMLSSSMKNCVFEAKVRHYDSALQSKLKPHNIPESVYDNLISMVNKNLSSLHRYVRLKKKILNLDEIHMYDLYVPLFENSFDHIEFEEGLKIIKEGLTPLGEEYLSILDKGINERWIDVFSNKGKKGGAYSWSTYDTKPFILANFNYQYNDVSTIAHELGHSIHSYYSNSTQPFFYSDYALFCAEVASITNECLLVNHLINKETDKSKKLYLLNQQLENIRTTFFRQTLFAEFEKITHEKIEQGEALTCEDYSSIYYELNKKYYGDEIILDEEIAIEWARIPHFYRDFYIYQYATGFAAANSFATSILAKKENARDKYIGFLKSGCIADPIEILKTAGVDMTSPKPIDDTIAVFNSLLDMLEKEI
ncbi:oligoendopeptidase F [Clostridiaceae bacterium 14S0207]|nr:oligoendopeptidase F [Clostridiaceae bacterium 14S0207]